MAFEAAKRLGSEAAKVGRHCHADNETDLDAKTPRGLDAWSVSGKFFMCIPFELLILL